MSAVSPLYSRSVQTSVNMSIKKMKKKKKLVCLCERLRAHSSVMARQPAACLPGPG